MTKHLSAQTAVVILEVKTSALDVSRADCTAARNMVRNIEAGVAHIIIAMLSPLQGMKGIAVLDVFDPLEAL